jgi:hypothetical protein
MRHGGSPASVGDLHDRLQINAHPGLFPNRADRDFDFAQRRFDGDGPVTTCDGGCTASNKAAATHHDSLARAGMSVPPVPNDDLKCSLEEHVVFQWRPLAHCFTS